MASSRQPLYPVLFLAVLLVSWGLVAWMGFVDSIILPAPWAVVGAVPQMVERDGFLFDMAATLRRVCIALLIACIVGIPSGLLLGFRRDIYRVVEMPLHALRSVPATAIFPLLLIVIGVGELSLIALAAYPSLLVITISGVTGASLANRSRLQQARLLGVTPWEMMTEVLFFEALPYILNGVRTAAGYTLVLVVAVEMFIGVGNSGLGRRIYDYQSAYRIPETYAAIIVTGIIGIVLSHAIDRLEQRLLRWMPQTQD